MAFRNLRRCISVFSLRLLRLAQLNGCSQRGWDSRIVSMSAFYRLKEDEEITGALLSGVGPEEMHDVATQARVHPCGFIRVRLAIDCAHG
jgi:hypothetical protein